MTACDLTKSFIFDMGIKIIGHVNLCANVFKYYVVSFPRYKIQKINSRSDLQGHSGSFILVPIDGQHHDFLLVFHCNAANAISH